jgi:hypothetical protein
LNQIPFSVYDFFAYLSSGSVVLATLDYVWKTGLLDQPKVSPLLGVLLVILAYVCGHVVAHCSSFILEQVFVSRILQRPASLLLGARPRLAVLRFVFPNYHRPLPESTQARVRAQAFSRGVSAEGEGLFLHVYPVVTSNDKLQARLDDFRNQYGFARNMSWAFLTSGLILGAAHLHDPFSVKLRVIALAFGMGVALLYRYLKFFRQYSYELFLRYAEQRTTAGA